VAVKGSGEGKGRAGVGEEKMRAIVCDGAGDENVMRVGEVDPPELRAGQLRIRVAATSVNRADLLQRQGLYPPPQGASPILGLECAGRVAELGPGVDGWKIGERVMALLPGGGYAAEAVVDAGSVMRVPDTFTDEEAGAFPEVFLTAFLNIFEVGAAKSGGSVLVHGGGSGVGTAAITLCKEAGARVFVTVGSEEKAKRCKDLGATEAFNYREEDFAERVREVTGGRGVDVILDCIGARYLDSNLRCLAVDGSLVVIGLMGGARAELDLASMLLKRLRLMGSTLRTRSNEDKAKVVRAFLDRFGSAMEHGRIRPVIHRVLPIEDVAEAHRMMKASSHFGKIVLRVGG
jgi:putative PIG3 family NAD(P)H quinone oxidoreductase